MHSYTYQDAHCTPYTYQDVHCTPYTCALRCVKIPHDMMRTYMRTALITSGKYALHTLHVVLLHVGISYSRLNATSIALNRFRGV